MSFLYSAQGHSAEPLSNSRHEYETSPGLLYSLDPRQRHRKGNLERVREGAVTSRCQKTNVLSVSTMHHSVCLPDPEVNQQTSAPTSMHPLRKWLLAAPQTAKQFQKRDHLNTLLQRRTRHLVAMFIAIFAFLSD